MQSASFSGQAGIIHKAEAAAGPINSHTEWGLLEEVIVGTPANAFFSFWDPIDRYLFSEEEVAEIEKYLKFRQPYPKEYVEKARAAIGRFVHILEAEGVKVRRLEEVRYDQAFRTPDWTTPGGFCAANPRDLLLAIGDQIIEAPMCSRSPSGLSGATPPPAKSAPAQNDRPSAASTMARTSPERSNCSHASAMTAICW